MNFPPRIFRPLIFGLFGILLLPALSPSHAASGCPNPGWFPTSFGLKDHSLFLYAGDYYLTAIYLPGETQFAYGRSSDLCVWEELTPILSERIPGAWDENRIWAPFVFYENGTYYLYYTGVTNEYTQSIMLATTSDPSMPDSWIEQGLIFQPNHPNMIWTVGQWADNRDPHVIKVGQLYYLYYTGTDADGGIIGLATADSPLGPWIDLGSVVTPQAGNSLESPSVFFANNTYYLVYHQTTPSGSEGAYSLINSAPTGLWTQPIALSPGWAHEFWQDQSGDWFTSYLTNFSITISPFVWDPFYSPPRPFIGSQILRTFLPVAGREN